MRSSKAFLALLSAVVTISWASILVAEPRPEFDASAVARPTPAATTALRRAASEAAIRRIGTPAHFDERFGVPTFLWANRAPASAPAPAARANVARIPDQAARTHLESLAPLYGLSRADVAGAQLRHVHDTGRGGIIATYRQVIGGIEVFRDEVKVLMNRNLDLVAVSGYIPASAERTAPAFKLSSRDAVGLALADYAPSGADVAALTRSAAAPGGYEVFDAPAAARSLPEGLAVGRPIRAKKVLFHMPEALVPGYYVEIMGEAEAYSYVISAEDGRLLFRHSLMASDSYTYRVWTDGTALGIPTDGPQGNAPTPHPTGLPDNYSPPYTAPGLETLQNGPISTNDPWLGPGATQTSGNNVDAYADLVAPDGFSAGDLRATTTGANTFDRVYNTSLAPTANADQSMASVTQLFYVNNFLHDWFYDAGFDEASGNAQALNYGRGGVQGDALHAQAQDYGGTNNANMSTPSDGGSPRMQMYVFTPQGIVNLTVNSPPSIAGSKQVGTAAFGPTVFSVTGNVVLVNDGSGTTSDGCEAIVNSIAGKIALIDRGSCTFVQKVQNAQLAGAIGVIIANNQVGAPPTMGGTPSFTITIPVLSITQADGAAMKTELLSQTVSVTMTRQADTNRDGTLDNQVVAHEWGHYISNRLVGDANGLSTLQSRGLGEGWGDFHAMLMSVQPEDALVMSNVDFNGVYSTAGYATGSSIAPTNSYYFGFRRYPYSTNLSKNPLTFQHIQNGVPLPVGPPVLFGADGANNAEVHNAGEVWATMLWECYAALLRDTGRLTFDEARDRMSYYLVAAYKLTPNQPTLTEARDALLAAAYVYDTDDFDLFWVAFAKRGAGVGAVSPDRFTADNVGVVESYDVGGDLAALPTDLDISINDCDGDGYLDNGERGRVYVTFKNTGSTSLGYTTVTLSSMNPFVSFPGGATAALAPTDPQQSAYASIPIEVNGASGIQLMEIEVAFDDPGLLVSGPRTETFAVYVNADDVPSTLETVESVSPAWTIDAALGSAGDPWDRRAASPTSHYFYVSDVGGISDHYLISPPIEVAAAGDFSFKFKHAFSFELDASNYYDGGVIEISQNNGATWTDIGGSAVPGYAGTIFSGSGNPLSGRLAFVGQNFAYPGRTPVTVNLGSAYAGKTVLVRFRMGTDESAGDYGWEIDDLEFFNIDNQPFLVPGSESGVCTPLAAEEGVPAELSLSMAGRNPAVGEARFRFGLPQAQRVELAIYDVAGRRVAVLADGTYEAGYHSAVWNRSAGATRAGVYFARMTANGRRLTQRVVMIR